MEWLVPTLFWILAVIHFLPAVAAIAPARISTLYGVDPADRTLLTLLQHRAVLLGLVGGAFACGAHIEAVRWPALIGGGFSMISFLVIAALQGELGGRLRIIAIVDALGLPILGALLFLFLPG